MYYIGIDEKSFGRSQGYISLMADLDSNRVLEMTAGRTIESCDKLWGTLSDEQRAVVTVVSMDMWQAFRTNAKKNVPEAEIVLDKFHISKHLNDAVDKVRRQRTNRCGARETIVSRVHVSFGFTTKTTSMKTDATSF
jgi:transposase